MPEFFEAVKRAANPAARRPPKLWSGLITTKPSRKLLDRLRVGETTVVACKSFSAVAGYSVRLKPKKFRQCRLIAVNPYSGAGQKVFAVIRTE